MVGTADKIDELKRDLGAASVKAKYDVTVETEKAGAEKPGRSKLKAGTLRLTFSAVAKDVAGRSEAQPEAQPEPETASA
jgi:hypothetical protein